MSLNIQTSTGLLEIGGKVTKEKVISALGYEPADTKVETTVDTHTKDTDIHITSDERKLWNNKSDFSGDYNDLENAPDILEDSSGDLSVTDESGNVIVRVDSNGLHTTEVEVKGIMLGQTLSEHTADSTAHVTSEEKSTWNNKSDFSGFYEDLLDKPNITEDSESKELTIADNSGNVIMKVDADGIHSTEADLGGMKVRETLEEHNEHIDNSDIHVTNEDKTKWNNKSDFSGNYADLQNAPDIMPEDDDKGLTISDESGNVIAKIDENGLETTKVTAKSVVINGTDIEAKINEHKDDSVSHITSSERTAWNAKATTDYVDEKVASLVNSAPETLNTLDELAKALGDDANFATTVTNQIAEKAKQSDLEEHKDDDVIHITASERETWNNKSDFSGNYVDLVDAPNIATDAEDKSLTVADESGNVVMKVDIDGLETTKVVSKSIVVNGTDVEATINEHKDSIDNTKEDLDIHTGNKDIHVTATDKSKWDAKSDFDGKYSSLTEKPDIQVMIDDTVNPHINNVDIHVTATDKNNWNTHKDNTVVHITATERTTWNNKSDFSGAYEDLVNAPDIKEDDSGDLVIADKDGNIIFRSNGNGFETTTLTAKNLTINGTDVGTTVDQHEDRIVGLETKVGEGFIAVTKAQIDTLFT